jgi:cytochrome c oxidase subunit 4
MTHGAGVEVRGYLIVFGTLLVLTLVTVGASYLRLPMGLTIALALSIATVKAGLVAGVFMHLTHERAMIYATLVLTAVLAVALFTFTAWTEADHPPGTRFESPYAVGVGDGKAVGAGAPEGAH